MFRTAAIAVIATCFGGAASPFGPQLFDTPAATDGIRRGVDLGKPGVQLSRAGDGLFHAPVWINGRRTTMIVDTGATVTVLTRADAARLKVDRENVSTAGTLRTASGPAAMTWAKVKSLRLGGMTLRDVDIAVVDHGLDHSLLGQDVLASGGVLRVEGDAMEIS